MFGFKLDLRVVIVNRKTDAQTCDLAQLWNQFLTKRKMGGTMKHSFVPFLKAGDSNQALSSQVNEKVSEECLVWKRFFSIDSKSPKIWFVLMNLVRNWFHNCARSQVWASVCLFLFPITTLRSNLNPNILPLLRAGKLQWLYPKY